MAYPGRILRSESDFNVVAEMRAEEEDLLKRKRRIGIDIRTPKKMNLDIVMNGFDDHILISFIV